MVEVIASVAVDSSGTPVKDGKAAGSVTFGVSRTWFESLGRGDTLAVAQLRGEEPVQLLDVGEAVPAEGQMLLRASVAQGQLEASNVNVVRTMVELLIAMRSYEAHQKTIQSIDQTAGQAAGDLGRA